MENENEQEVDIDEDFEETAEVDEDTTDWKARALELEQKSIKQRARTKALKDELSKFKTAPVEKQEQKQTTNEPDYAKLAYLKSEGVTHPEDQKLVQDEANRLKLPLTDILNMGHIKSQLENNKDQREAMAGAPKGNGSRGNQTQNDVDYWLAKGETPDDLELAEKVIDARMNKIKNANKFSDELYTG